MSFRDRLDDIAPSDPTGYVPFYVDGLRVGIMSTDFATHLRAFGDVFTVRDDAVCLNDALSSPATRSHAVAQVMDTLRERGHVTGWRDELYPVNLNFHDPALFMVERAAAIRLGVRTYAVNLNGFMRDSDGLSLWVARRAAHKQINPNKLDLIVSGGQPAGISLRDNLVKECMEEAGMVATLASRAVSVSAISFYFLCDAGIHNAHYFNYDLELPTGFIPVNQDGEVSEFMLWPVERILTVLRDSDDFASDSALVVLDFLVRHGVIEADHPEYMALAHAMVHSPGA